MANPPLVEVWRDGLLESVHRGRFAVMDAGGRVLASAGDMDVPVFPRSAYKLLQAIALVESGAADAAGLRPEELSIACASHFGARIHADTVTRWLKRLGIPQSVLECGVQEPQDLPERNRLIQRRRPPQAVHNNCSGKHAGFVTLARHMDLDLGGYTKADHPLQQRINTVIKDLCGIGSEEDVPTAIDGCSAPNLGMPLRAFGLGVARCAARTTLSPARAAAVTRLFEAQAAHPIMLAGEGGLDTVIARDCGAQVLAKMGAEGVYAAYAHRHGIGIVLKMDDGTRRGSESAICEILARLGLIDPSLPGLQPFHAPVMRNWRGTAVGKIRPASDAFSCLSTL